jgi:hypothetical protein
MAISRPACPRFQYTLRSNSRRGGAAIPGTDEGRTSVSHDPTEPEVAMIGSVAPSERVGR